jgi:hypothetical protein
MAIEKAICSETFRLLIMDIANQNGGLVNLAKKANINPSALWNQMNRGKGPLAYTIPLIVKATGDDRPLHLINQPCGYIPIRDVRFKRREQSIPLRKKEIDLSITIGKALEIIEKAYEDGKVSEIEYKKIHDVLNEIRQKSVEMDESIKADKK